MPGCVLCWLLAKSTCSPTNQPTGLHASSGSCQADPRRLAGLCDGLSLQRPLPPLRSDLLLATLPWSTLPADPKQLAEFWDGLSEAERRSVMEVKEEHNGERTLREVRSYQVLRVLGCCVRYNC